MIDHVSLAVSDLARAVAFYERVLAPLGLTKLVTREKMVGFGKTYPEVWINLRDGMTRLPVDSGAHVALRAKTTAEIDAFHMAAVAAGGIATSQVPAANGSTPPWPWQWPQCTSACSRRAPPSDSSCPVSASSTGSCAAAG